MKKAFTVAFVFMFAVALLGLTGCGNPEAPQAAPIPQEQVQTPATPPAAGQDVVQAPAEIQPQEVVEITMVNMITGGRSVPRGAPEVFDAINEITEPLIGVRVVPMIIEAGVYSQQVSMMLTAREPIDLVQTVTSGPVSYTVAAPQGHFIRMDDLLDNYGHGIRETLGQIIEGTRIGENLYGVPGFRNMVQGFYVVMRMDVLEDLDLVEQAQAVQSVQDLDAIFQVVADNTDLVPLSGGVDANVISGNSMVFADYFTDWYAFDSLGCTMQLIRSTPDGRVLNNFAQPEFRRAIETVRDWYERGFVYRDLAIRSEHAATYINNDISFAYFVATEVGGNISHENIAGVPLLFIRIADGPSLTTGLSRGFTWTIPSASREPEAAMRFLNLMYTDARIANLLAWGLEGRDYVLIDGVAHFPDGQDASTSAYHSHDFIFGNQFLKHQWAGTIPNLRQMAQQDMANAGVSQFLGFSADLSSVDLEILAVQGVIDQFIRQIRSGSAPMSVFDEFLVRLEQVGADDIVAEYQRQLDDWLANR